jgi:hypothetical protein
MNVRKLLVLAVCTAAAVVVTLIVCDIARMELQRRVGVGTTCAADEAIGAVEAVEAVEAPSLVEWYIYEARCYPVGWPARGATWRLYVIDEVGSWRKVPDANQQEVDDLDEGAIWTPPETFVYWEQDFVPPEKTYQTTKDHSWTVSSRLVRIFAKY